jgi:hypothetical protein
MIDLHGFEINIPELVNKHRRIIQPVMCLSKAAAATPVEKGD